MSDAKRTPLIGISACRKQIDPHPFNIVGEKYINGIVDGADAMPMMIPPLGDRLDIEELLGRVDGLLLTGSPSNIEPQHYGGNDSVPPHDPYRDATTLKLLRRAVERAIPLLAICRGCQEVNVAYGGTLHPQLDQVEGLIRHREDSAWPLEQQYAPTHKLELRDGGLLASLAGKKEVSVNSLHTQGVAELGAGLLVEATASDGLIEAFSVQNSAAFSLAVQWHPEWRVVENQFYLAIFRAFGAACRQRLAGIV